MPLLNLFYENASLVRMRSPVQIWLAAPKEKARPKGWAFSFGQ